MRYSLFLSLILVGSVSVGKAQSPGLRPFKQDPNFLKVELKKKTSLSNLGTQVATNNQILKIRNGVFSFQATQGKVYRMNIDGMPCVVVNPTSIDPKSIVLLRSVPYMPNPYK